MSRSINLIRNLIPYEMIPADHGSNAFEELAVDYENTVSGELQKFWGFNYESFVNYLLEHVKVNKNDCYLDLATGTSLIPRILVNKLGLVSQVIGLDITLPVLKDGKLKISKEMPSIPIYLVCGSALTLPFAPNSIDGAICALASHHLDQAQLLAEVNIVLRSGGQFVLADVAASEFWQFPGAKTFLRLAAFIYFLLTNSFARAWVESKAVSNVYTASQWAAILRLNGFTEIVIHRPSIRRPWVPSAILITASKS